jgi:pilus assembly protein CpaD
MTRTIPIAHHRAFRLFGTLAGLAVVLGGCVQTSNDDVTATIPEDYRLRHPIAIQEANQSVVVFV